MTRIELQQKFSKPQNQKSTPTVATTTTPTIATPSRSHKRQSAPPAQQPTAPTPPETPIDDTDGGRSKYYLSIICA